MNYWHYCSLVHKWRKLANYTESLISPNLTLSLLLRIYITPSDVSCMLRVHLLCCLVSQKNSLYRKYELVPVRHAAEYLLRCSSAVLKQRSLQQSGPDLREARGRVSTNKGAGCREPDKKMRASHQTVHYFSLLIVVYERNMSQFHFSVSYTDNNIIITLLLYNAFLNSIDFTDFSVPLSEPQASHQLSPAMIAPRSTRRVSLHQIITTRLYDNRLYYHYHKKGTSQEPVTNMRLALQS